MTSVLFVRLSAMGDVVQGLGAVAALHRVRPAWATTFVTQREFAPLLAGAPGVGRVVTFARDGGVRALWGLRAALRTHPCDVALDLQGNWKSALVTRLSGARRLLGMAGRWRQEPLSRWLLHETIEVDATPHPARAAWELVRALAPDAPFTRPRLAATAAEMDAERAALRAAGVDPQRPFLVVVRSHSADPRSLRPAAVIEARASGVPAVHLVGPGEAALVVDGGPTLRHHRGELRRLVALGAVVAAAGGEVLGPDRGATHVLAAAGATCRVLFGSQEPRRTAPPAAVALRHPAPPPCSPCRRRRCHLPEGPLCMDFTVAEGRIVDLGLPPAS